MWSRRWTAYFNNIARSEEAGCRLVFSQMESNWPLPYSTMPVLLLRDARPAGWVNCFSICSSTMPRAQKVQFSSKDEIVWRSGYIIYLWWTGSMPPRSEISDPGSNPANNKKEHVQNLTEQKKGPTRSWKRHHVTTLRVQYNSVHCTVQYSTVHNCTVQYNT